MNETIDKTTIFLAPDDVKLFIEFQKHFSLIQLLVSLGVFDIRSGSVEIHFDKEGKIASVDIHKHFRV